MEMQVVAMERRRTCAALVDTPKCSDRNKFAWQSFWVFVSHVGAVCGKAKENQPPLSGGRGPITADEYCHGCMQSADRKWLMI
jgi:hypothetical protein